MNISKLTRHDLPSLASLYEQFWGEESSVGKMESTFATLEKNPDYIFLVARQDNGIVGSVMGIICYELYGECKPFMVIEDVIVDRNERRQGVGSKLMQALEKHACDQGCAYIIFVTETDRLDAHRFYESSGYSPSGYKGFKKRL